MPAWLVLPCARIPRSTRLPYPRVGCSRTPSISSNSERAWTPSFWYTCLEWVFTVFVPM